MMIINCIISNNVGTVGGGMWSENQTTARIVNCVFYKNTAFVGSAIRCANRGTPVISNTIFAENIGCAIYEELWEGVPDASDPITTNCLFFNNTGGILRDADTLITHTDVATLNGLAEASGNIEGNPLFRNAAGGDFRVLYGSPCIDAGIVPGTTDSDFLSHYRPFDVHSLGAEGTGTEFDIGPHEFGAGPPPVTSSRPDSWTLYE